MNYVIVALPVALLLFIFLSYFLKRKTPVGLTVSPRRAHRMLMKVRFYKNLSPEERGRFRKRVLDFLQTVRISPAQGVKLRMLDRIYVASAAIIPVFKFPDWQYNNLNEVVVRTGNFSKDFKGTPEEQNVMGMVGDGAMHRMMVLSLGALRTGFEQSGRGNTAIHEFVHLIDKSDGAVDGLPEVLIPDELTDPWLEYMRGTIEDIRTGRNNDINPYGATSEAEFLSVISEYYFQRPEYLKEKHPELFALLEQIYGHQQEVPDAAAE